MKHNRYINLLFSFLIPLMLSGVASAAEISPEVESFEEALATFAEDDC